MAAEPLDLDAIRAAMAEAMHKADCGCGLSVSGDQHTPDVDEWYGSLADAALRAVAPTLERLEAHQLPDGGTWSVRYGRRVGNAGVMWSNPGFRDVRDDMHRREWRGPATPIAAGDDRTQPITARPVVAAVTRSGPVEG